MRDLLSCIDSWSQRAPERVAHVSPSGRLSYGELGRGSAAVAAVVQDALPDDRSPVVVIGHKEPEMLIAFLGSARAGHPYVPIDISVPSHRIR
ncbi:MAG: AMP-binding protein, partial [Chloroflexi bacterium]|nr:AMP-binding protein [Chloroflexota bacterium]